MEWGHIGKVYKVQVSGRDMGIQVDTKFGEIESAIIYAPFDRALDTLIDNNYSPISLSQNAHLRICLGKETSVSGSDNWVREGVLYFPKGKPKLVRNSSILRSAKDATISHYNNREFHPASDQIEKALENSIDLPKKEIKIPTNRFNSNAFTVYAFGGEKEAKAYGDFLRKSGIKEMFFYILDKSYVDRKAKPFERQVLFGKIGYIWSDLSGCYRTLDHDFRLRGVKWAPKAPSQKKQLIKKPNNQSQLQ